jgi:hypothetical protein
MTGDPDRAALLGVLVEYHVLFVLIGGAAIQSHGHPYDTQDIDITPDVSPENLARLAAALNDLECRLVIDPADTTGWVPLPPDYFTPRTILAARSGTSRPVTASSTCASLRPVSPPASPTSPREPHDARRPGPRSSFPLPRWKTSTHRNAKPTGRRIASTSSRPMPRRS